MITSLATAPARAFKTPVSSHTQNGEPPTPPERGWWDKVVDQKEGVSLLVGGSVYLRNKEEAQKLEAQLPPLAQQPAVTMQRPLVICPGWNTELHKFDYLAAKLLASETNGDSAVYLHMGKAYADAECQLPLEQIPSNSKVFVNIWDTRKTPPQETSLQLKQNLELVRQAAGDGPIDLLGYSMGGLASRKFLDNGGQGIKNFMMLGTPNQGTRFAQMSDRVIAGEVGWALKFSGLTEQDAPAMKWLAADSPTLNELNQRWPQQLAQVERAMVVGSRHELTPAVGWLPFRKGDGMVEPERLALPGIPTVVLEDSPFLHHGALPHDDKVYQQMIGFFGFEPIANSEGATGVVLARPDGPQTPYGEL